MAKILAALIVVGALMTPAPYASAAPELPLPPVEGETEAVPDTGNVPSAEPAVVTTPDGWELKLAAKDETQLPIPALTTATTSREYLAGGTFTGSIGGSGSTSLRGGTLEAGPRSRGGFLVRLRVPLPLRLPDAKTTADASATVARVTDASVTGVSVAGVSATDSSATGASNAGSRA